MMTAERHAELQQQLLATLAPRTDAQLITMHALAYKLFWDTTNSPTDSAAIGRTLVAIEEMFERRGIPYCKDCGLPNGQHEPDFCPMAGCPQ